MVESKQSDTLKGCPHGFFGRRGGVSTSTAYQSLNCGLGSADDRETVRENRRRVATSLGFEQVTTGYQVHGTAVAYVTETCETAHSGSVHSESVHSGSVSSREDGGIDGLVTDRPGILLGVLTADCAPILLADLKAGIVGACHAGWRGAVSGIAEATIAVMRNLGAQDIVAAIGPAIGKSVYEVGSDMRSMFPTSEADTWFTPLHPSSPDFASPDTAQKWLFDLQGHIAARLKHAGLQNVSCVLDDTYSMPETYFSARYAKHHGLPDYGRNLSVIGVTPLLEDITPDFDQEQSHSP